MTDKEIEELEIVLGNIISQFFKDNNIRQAIRVKSTNYSEIRRNRKLVSDNFDTTIEINKPNKKEYQ